MSDHLPDALFEDAAPQADPGRRARAASVTLREHDHDADDPAALMDPAAKSLADALRITFRLLQLAMLVLLAVFIFSGSQSIQQGERGIRVFLGKPVATDLGPGFHWSPPHPIGELVRIPLTSPSITLNEAFWPFLPERDRDKTSTELIAQGGMDSLSPERDGAVLTSEGFIAHVRCAVRYQREDPKKAHEMIRSEKDESSIVQAAVRRGIIHAAAVLSVDELLKDIGDPGRPAGEFRSLSTIAQDVAQQTLDEMDCGLRILDIGIIDRMPPQVVGRDYNKPAQALAQASAAIQTANEERRAILTGVAGDAADLILSQIDLYEEQLQLGQLEEAAATHARIDALLLGEEVEIPGYEGPLPRIDGTVPAMLAEARQYRSTIASATRAEAIRFRAIRESYRSNPEVVLHREWAEALKTFLVRDNVQVQLLPPGQEWVVLINKDPTISREQERERLLKLNKELEEQRRREREQERFRRRADPNKERVTAN